MKDFLKNPHRRVELLIGGILLALMLAAQVSVWMDPVESMLLDLRFRMRGENRMSGGVVMVGIDEASLDHPRSGPWPWSRNQYARLLETLSREGLKPRAVGFDKLFESKDPKDETGDASFQFRAEIGRAHV